MESVYQTVKKILTSSVLPFYDSFFPLLNEASEILESEKTEYRPCASDNSAGSLLDFHNDNLPLIVIPDLHARPYFLMNILDYPIFEDATIFEALEAGRIRLLSVGDILHTERNTRERWAAAAVEFKNDIFTGPALSAEMQEGLCLLEGILYLKSKFPEYVHILKGNHENILNTTGNGDFAFRKFADEGEMGMVFVQDYYGDDILYLINCVEKNLPLVYFGKNCVVSHAEPFKPYTKNQIVDAKLIEGVVGGLTWTDNGEAKEGSAIGIIENLCCATQDFTGEIGDYVYLGGHRPVAGNYRLLQNGCFIQIHNPGRQNVAFVKPDKKFNPDTDLIEVANR